MTRYTAHPLLCWTCEQPIRAGRTRWYFGKAFCTRRCLDFYRQGLPCPDGKLA